MAQIVNANISHAGAIQHKDELWEVRAKTVDIPKDCLAMRIRFTAKKQDEEKLREDFGSIYKALKRFSSVHLLSLFSGIPGGNHPETPVSRRGNKR
jgi:hypothetical protein